MSREETRSKVGRLIREYDLSGVGEELERRWTGEGTSRQSLRDLAGWFNRRLLRAALVEAGRPSTRDVDQIYRTLTGEEATGGKRRRQRSDLERAGVDVDELERDFVSHQAVYTYLTEYRGVSCPDSRDDAEQLEKETGTLQRLRSRVEAVTEQSVRRMRDTDRIALGEFDVLVDVRVYCRDCDTDHGAVELLRNGGCDCPE